MLNKKTVEPLLTKMNNLTRAGEDKVMPSKPCFSDHLTENYRKGNIASVFKKGKKPGNYSIVSFTLSWKNPKA